MRSAVILHSVSDARHCVANNLHEGRMLFSTHSSVDVYLKERHGLDCQCLSRFISTEEMMNERKAWIGAANTLLKDLDSHVSPMLNSKFDLKMDYFIPLYSFTGVYHLLGYVWFVNCVKRIADRYKLEKISFYDYRFNRCLAVDTTVSDLVSLFFRDIRSEIIKIPENKITMEKGAVLKNIISKLKRLKGCNLRFINKKITAELYKYGFARFSHTKKTILVSELLYELEFLCGHLSKYNVLYYDLGKENFLGFKKQRTSYDINLDFDKGVAVMNITDPFLKIFLRDIKEDLMNNINQYLDTILLIKEMDSKYPISLGIWGGSPAWSTRAIIFEYLSSKGIKIMGSQHGCLYGETFSPFVFETDFNRCDYFISWGFTREDLERIYPSKRIDVEILPFGKTDIAKHEKTSRKIDLLFPVSMSFSIFDGGMDGVFPDKLTERQTRLLEYLDSIRSFDIYIKPFMGSDYKNCSVLPVLEKLKNLKVIDNIPLTEFLEKYSPRAVLIEVPSSPLFDVLPLDTEIFLMDNPAYPYENKALEELKKRVHYCEDVAEVIAKIDLFVKGKLEKKRDDTFYKHYMYKERTEEKILNLIDSLVTR